MHSTKLLEVGSKKTRSIMMLNDLHRKRNGVLDKQKTNKANVPPQTISNILQRSAKTNRVPTKNPRGKWSSESLEATVDAVETNITSLQRLASFEANLYLHSLTIYMGRPKTGKLNHQVY
jgi:hypothetical protein